MPAPRTTMRLYPAVRSRRTATIAADVLIAVLLAIFAWFADSAHDAVSELSAPARGVEQAGSGAQRSFEEAASRVDEVPLVGDALADALRAAGVAPTARPEQLGIDEWLALERELFA